MSQDIRATYMSESQYENYLSIIGELAVLAAYVNRLDKDCVDPWYVQQKISASTKRLADLYDARSAMM